MIPNFNIATDLKVELFLPDEASDLFILGISELGGTDVLAGAGQFIIGASLLGGTDLLSTGSADFAFTWQSVEAETVAADFGLGGSIESNLFFQPQPGDCNLTLQSWVFDPNNNSGVRPGTKIRVRLDKGEVQHTLFSGFIDTVDVSYYPNATQPNIIQIKAFDYYKRLVNTRIDDFDTTGLPAGYATPNEVLQIVADNADLVISDDSDELVGKLPLEQKLNSAASGFINDATLVGLGILWIDPETSELVVKQRPTIVTSPPEGTYTVGNNHGDALHLCMSDIGILGNIDAVANSLFLQLTSDPEVNLSITDTDSIELYGYSSRSESINTTDIDELTRWGNAVFAQSPSKLVSYVETPAIDRQGTLTEAAAFKPGTLIGVDYTTSNISIQDFYTIVRVSHTVDVNNWYTTLELWKEF
jgi:hypothetical protein